MSSYLHNSKAALLKTF